MKEKSHMTIGEFSRLTGIKRENLRFYDQIGLLSPERRGDNDYRHYTRRQLSTAYLIASLRELGIGLAEIKQYADRRTPEGMLALFKNQEKRIDDEIAKLRRLRGIMRLNGLLVRDALAHEKQGITLVERKAEALFLGPSSAPGPMAEETMLTFYDLAAEQGMELGYPMGVWVGRPGAGTEEAVMRYYFKVLRGGNAIKPAGRYAVAYGRCAPGREGEIYDRLMAYLKERGLRVRDELYEEYPLGELSIQDEEQYCTKVEVPLTES